MEGRLESGAIELCGQLTAAEMAEDALAERLEEKCSWLPLASRWNAAFKCKPLSEF